MDPLTVMMNQSSISPVFQPVFNLEKYEVIGYEVLGNINFEEKNLSLGSFFMDSNVPQEYKWEIEELLQIKAIDMFLEKKEQHLPYLFFNVDPNTLYFENNHELFIERIEKFEKKGFPRQKVVLYMNFHQFDGDIEELSHVFRYLKANEIKLGLTDLGKKGSDLYTLSQLEPNLFKVNMLEMKETSSSHSIRDVLDSLTLFARKIGAVVAFEGISDVHKLYTAWKHSGRFLQGNLLSSVVSSSIGRSVRKQFLDTNIKSFVKYDNNRFHEQWMFVQKLDDKLRNIQQSNTHEDFILREVTKLAFPFAFRAYICDANGYQKSPNYIKVGQEWKIDEQALGKNWSWRSYFLENLVQMEHGNIGIISDSYRDIDSNELIRTYSFRLSSDRYLFIDISQDFLYEKDWLR
ncbi:EAL domain-containing protein [Bacillus shivajii]|uniref:EAL domain-containing protein n=1 Tax=Bacillus shivajii TaxID=1983719 RepID=UPI001CFB8CCD|nr:EAL-associated domain-containing protein [Bacillus shivajii]UCZ51580.1 EAL domain-containing protein [Bacillus shivajii]